MRIAVGQLWQESNTFNPLPTTRADFDEFGVSSGDEMLRQMAKTNELGGFIQSLAAWPEKPEVVGLVRLPAWPSGRATAETFDWLRARLIETLESALPVDGVLLALHGSMVAAEHPDVEGEVLEAVRAAIGPRTPLVATCDLHANLTERMVRSADALVVFHTVPHLDVFETGDRGAAVMRRILVEGARPVSAFQKIPAVLPVELANTEAAVGVSVDLKRRLQELERNPAVLSAALATVQPWLDIPDLGSAVLVVTDGDERLAADCCRELAAEVWSRRREYLPSLVSAEEAVRRAHQVTDGLVVLSDGADSTNSGAPGDSVWILKELVRHQWPRPVLVTLVAPQVVDQARQTGNGNAFEVELGGVRDIQFGTRIQLHVTVERLFGARFTVLSGHLGKNMSFDLGPSAVLRHGNVRIVVTSRSGPHFAPELFRSAGLEPLTAGVLVAKSPCGFRAAYEPHAREIYNVQAPGCAPSDFWNYPYEQISRPLWPWDEIDAWQPNPLVASASPVGYDRAGDDLQ